MVVLLLNSSKNQMAAAAKFAIEQAYYEINTRQIWPNHIQNSLDERSERSRRVYTSKGNQYM